MAEAIAINASGGIPPVPTGATNVSQRGSGTPTSGHVDTPPGSLPVDALLNIQASNPAPAQAAPAGMDAAEFAAFQAWKASQAAPKPAAPQPTPAGQAPLVAPTAALDTAQSAAQHDPVLNGMLGLMRNSVPGLDLQRAIGNALTYGDARLIDQAYLQEVGKEKAQSLLEVAQGVVNHAVASAHTAAQAVVGTAGSQEAWDAAAAAFNKGAPAHLKQYVGYAMKSGNQQQIVAAAQSVVEFARASGLVPVLPTGQVTSAAGSPGSAQGLSKVEFQKALAALDKNAIGYEQARGELFGRRDIGIRLGM